LAALLQLLRNELACDVSIGSRFSLFSLNIKAGVVSHELFRDCFATFLRQDAFALLVECAKLPGCATALLFLKTICKLVDMYKEDLLLVARGGGSNNISLLFNLVNHLHSSAANKECTGSSILRIYILYIYIYIYI
jgi:hypothetical protein